MILLNSLKTPDIVFFVTFFVVIALIVGFYFLIPVIKRKKYAEQRNKLFEREKAFRSNIKQEDKQIAEGKEN